MKHMLVVCGNRTVASAVMVTKIRGKCGDNGTPVSVTQCRLLEVEFEADDFDLLVTTGKFMGDSANISVVGTTSLPTGANEDATLNELLSYLR